MPFSFKFVNREYEQMQICNPGADRFILVNGAAGYGKSHLLGRVRDWYANHYQGSWKTALIDLKEHRSAASAPYPQSCLSIANLIGDALCAPINVTNSTGPDWEDQLAAVVMPCLLSPRAHVLLLFDGVEVLCGNTSQWLKHILFSLYSGLKKANRELRVVFAGRNVEEWGRSREISIRELSLSPFEQAPVRDMVRQVATAFNVVLPEDDLEQLTWWILRLSGGHPGSICNILEVLQTIGLVSPNLEFTFLKQRDFVFGDRQGSLFDVCVRPHIEELLQGVNQDLVKVLQVLSPIRHLNDSLLLALFENNIIDSSASQPDWAFLKSLVGRLSTPTDVNGHKAELVWDLLKQLRTYRLLHHPTCENPMYSDRILRRMLAMQTRLQEPNHYRRVHELAANTFEEWANAPETRIPPDIRRVAIQDSLYHILMLALETKQSKDDIRAELIGKMNGYLAGFTEVDRIQQLDNALANDRELEDIICWRVGNAAWNDLTEVVDNYIQQQ